MTVLFRDFLLREIDGRITIACAVLCVLTGIFFDAATEWSNTPVRNFSRWAFFAMPVPLFLFWTGCRIHYDKLWGRPFNVAVRSIFPIGVTGYVFARFLGFL